MNITLTGATGFIGSHLATRLRAKDHRLTIIRRADWDTCSPDPPPFSALEGADAIIHLAGEPVAQRWTPAVKDRIRSSRINGTRNLISALSLLKQKPSVLLSASAIGIYGSRGDETLTEQSAPAPGFLADVSNQWEEEAAHAAQLGIRTVRLRIGIVLGNNGGALAKMLPIFRCGLGAPLGNGRQWMSWIHIEDAVSMILHALHSPSAAGPWNLTAPNPVTNREFTKTLASTLHRPTFLPVPLRLHLLYGEMAAVVLASQRVLPQASLNNGFTFRFPHLNTALANLLGAG